MITTSITILIVIIIIIAYIYSNKTNLDPIKIKSCIQDSDCIEVQDGCCDCNNYGKNTAINKNFLNEYNNQQNGNCKDVACLTALSRDPTCTIEMSPKCIENKCILIEE